MALSKGFEAFAAELLAELGPIRIKRMFGGAAAYLDERIFALLDDEAIWIKVDDQSEPLFEAEGCPRISYATRAGERMEMRYRRLPDSAMDDPAEAARWARIGVETAARGPVKKPKKPRSG